MPSEIALSVVTPAHDEAENLPSLVAEIERALDPLDLAYEIIVIDDGSGDGTPALLRKLLADHPRLRAVRMRDTPPGRGHGQSAAFHAGFRLARGTLIAVLDADLQNDPADLPAMLDRLQATGADMVQGDRSRDRRDTLVRRASSVVGRLFRRTLLGDSIRDTGCSLRVMRRVVALALPLQFRGMHRFIPITARDLGYTVVEMPVRHRPRAAGSTSYGISNRALPGLVDCFAVRWMRMRRRPVVCDPVETAVPTIAITAPDPSSVPTVVEEPAR
jgi:glycosyltransferase involved in cell wall biosynthesis